MIFTPENTLPHRPPMLLVDRITAYDLADQTIETAIDITPDSLFYDPQAGGVPSYAALEYMAQSVGCFAGIYDLTQEPPQPPKAGFVLGTRRFTATRGFLPPGTYTIKAKALFFDEESASFDITLYDVRKQLVCHAALNAYRPKDLTRFKEEHA